MDKHPQRSHYAIPQRKHLGDCLFRWLWKLFWPYPYVEVLYTKWWKHQGTWMICLWLGIRSACVCCWFEGCYWVWGRRTWDRGADVGRQGPDLDTNDQAGDGAGAGAEVGTGAEVETGAGYHWVHHWVHRQVLWPWCWLNLILANKRLIVWWRRALISRNNSKSSVVVIQCRQQRISYAH